MNNYPKQGDIYWFDPDPSKGSEIRKIRPCVVVSPNEMNQNIRTIIIAPLTSTIQPWPFRMTVKVMGQKSSIACDQIRSVDRARLKARIGKLKTADKERIFELIHSIFSL